MKAVVIGALAATVYSAAADYNYEGSYIVGDKTGTDCCWPDGDVAITKTGTQYKAAWTFATCTGTNAVKASTDAVGLLATPNAAGDIEWSETVGTNTGPTTLAVKVPTTVNGNFVLDMGTTLPGCSAILQKKTATAPAWEGVYEVKKQYGTANTCCYPDGDIDIRVPSTGKVSADFRFNKCTTTGLTGYSLQKVSSGVVTPTTDTLDVSFTGLGKTWILEPNPVTKIVDGATLLLNLGAETAAADCAVAIGQKTVAAPTFPAVYEVDGEVGPSVATDKCCYPAGDITVTQDSTSKKVTVGWTFESDCGVTGVAGKTVSAGSTPDALTNDITIADTVTGNTYTLEAPSSAKGAWKLDLSEVADGCAVNLDTKSGYLLGLGSLVAVSLSYIMF